MTVVYVRQISSAVFLEECQRIVAQMFPIKETYNDGDLFRQNTPFGVRIYKVHKTVTKWLWVFKHNVYTFSKTPILEVLVHKDLKPARNLKPELIEFTIKVTHDPKIKTVAQTVSEELNADLQSKLSGDWNGSNIKINVLCTETV